MDTEWKEGNLYKIVGFNMKGHQQTVHFYRNQLVAAGITIGTIFEFIQENISENLIEIKINDNHVGLQKDQIKMLRIKKYEN